MSTGRRSRKAKSAASDMFKRFARGEDLLVESASKYSYSVGQKQVKEQPVRKKPQSTPGTPERNALSTTDKGVPKCDLSTKSKPQSDDTGNKDVSTTRLKKPTKTMLKLKVIPQVASIDTDMQLPLKVPAGKSRDVRKVLSNDRRIVVIQKHKVLPEVATQSSAQRCDDSEGIADKDSSNAEEQCRAEVDPPRRDNMRTKCSTSMEKVMSPLTPKKHTEDNLWSHNKNFSLSPRVKVVSPVPTSECPAEGVYTVSVLTNLAQTEAKLDIKKEPISPNTGNQTVVSTSQQRERHSSPVAAISKCASPIQRISARGATKKSHANPTSDVKCIPSEKTHRVVVKESASKCDGDSFTKIKLVKVKPACSKHVPISPLPLPYPSDAISQEKFFHIFGLVKKSVLAKDVSITNKLHREAGGKLRRNIKPCMKPEMVYRRLELARGCIIQGMHEKIEALSEWKSKPGGLQDTRVFMYDERRKRHEIIADNKVALLAAIPRNKPLMKAGSGRSSPVTDVALVKELKDTVVKSARKLCFDGLIESPTRGPMQYLKPKAKKRKHLAFDGGTDAAKTRRAESPSCHVSSENLSKKVMESQKKDKEAAKPVMDAAMSPVPSRRSARQQGGKRKMWCHLLRAAPDEYIVDQQWETEQQKKEEKRRAKVWRNTGEGSAETSQENSSNEDDVSSGRHSTTSDLPVESDVAQRSETPAEDSAVLSPLAKKIKIEADEEVALIDESCIKVEPTDLVKHKKKKKKKKKPALVDDDMSVQENVIGPDGHPALETKCPMLFDQLKPGFSDIANNSGKICDDANFIQNNNKESLECNETLPYVFSSSAGASPSGTWPVAHGERYHYADYECTIPHMCMVCWINDHMYCKNMKRVARDLPPCGGCIHYIPCKHYRYLKDMLTYSRKKITKMAPAIDKSASAAMSCGDVKASPTDLNKAQISVDDLLCYEEMLESDSEPSSPDTPAGTEILKAHLKARASQIAKSLGVKRLSSLNSVVSEVMVAPTEDKSDSERSEVDICEFGAEVILLSDNGFNYTRVHEHMLTGVQPQNVPVSRSVRVDSASKAVKEAGSKSIISAVKDIKMPGKFCIRVAHQGGGVKPGVAADGQKVIKVKVQRVEPKKLLLQATPSGGEADDGKISLDVVPEEREICLPANKRGDADFDSDLLGGIIAQEAMKLVSSGNFRPQLLKLTFDGDVTLPFSKVDEKKEPGMSEKGKSKKKARKRQRDENLEEMQRNSNLVGEPRVTWSIESLPENLDKEESMDTTKWSSPPSRVAQINQKDRLTPHEHGTTADAKQVTVHERPLDSQRKQTDSSTLMEPTAAALRNKKPECKKREFVEPWASSMSQKKAVRQSKKPAETHQSNSPKKQNEKASSVPPVECETKIQEQEVAQPRHHDYAHATKRNGERTEYVSSQLGKPHVETTDTVNLQVSRDTSSVTSSRDTSVVSDVVSKTATEGASAMEQDLIPLGHVVISVDSDVDTVTNSADTGEHDTSAVGHVVDNVDTDIRTVTSSACAVENDTVVMNQVVRTFDSDVGSFDSGIASYDSAVGSGDYSADHADSCVTGVSSVTNTTVGGDSGISDDTTPDSGVYLCNDVIHVSGDATNKPVADTYEPTDVMSTTSVNTTIQDDTTEVSDGDVSVGDTSVNPSVNQVTLDEFLASMTLAGVPADEINALRQQMTSLVDGEIIELVTPNPQQMVSDQLSTSSHIDQENPSVPLTPVSSTDHQLASSQDSHDDVVEEVVSESTVVIHDDVQTVGSEIETNTSIVECQADELGPFIICDGQIVHYNAQTGVMVAVDGAALEEVPQSVVDDTANIEYSTEESYVFASDGLCQSVDSSSVDEYDIAQIASQPLA